MFTQTTVARFKGVGKYNGQINCVSIEVIPGTLGFATALLNELHYEEIETQRKFGTWGITAFFNHEASASMIRLTAPSSRIAIPMSENRVAFSVEDAYTVAHSVRDWARACGFACALSDEEGPNKFVVQIPQVFTIPLEFVSR